MAFKRPYSGGGSWAKQPRTGSGANMAVEPLPVGLVATGLATSSTPVGKSFSKSSAPPPIPAEWQTEPAKDAHTNPVPDHKGGLCRFLGKSLHISLEKGDLEFHTVRVKRGFKSTFTCRRLPKRHAGSWVGDCYTDKKSAEQSAAGEALNALMAIPELVASAAMSKEERIQEKQNRIAQREQEKYARAIQAQVVASQQLLQQQQLAAYTQQVQQAQLAVQQQQQQQQAAIAAQLQQVLAVSASAVSRTLPTFPTAALPTPASSASAASRAVPPLPTATLATPGSLATPILSATMPAGQAMPALGALGAAPNLSNLLASINQHSKAA